MIYTKHIIHHLLPIYKLFLNSPGTTNQQTYKVVGVSASGNTFKVNRGNTDTDSSAKIRGASSITVMEVAA